MDTKKIFTIKKAVPVFAIFCCFLWGSAIPAVKIGYNIINLSDKDIFPKVFVAGFRFFIAGLILFAIVKFVYKLSLKIEKQYWLKVFLLGILQTFLQEMFFYIGISNTTGAKAAVLSTCDLFFVILFAHFMFKGDRISINKILGLIVGFSGIILINFEKGFSLDFSFAGEGLLILFGIINAFSTIMAKKLIESIHPFVLTAWQLFIGSTALLLVGSGGDKKVSTLFFRGEMMGLILYLSLVSAVAYIAVFGGLLPFIIESTA